MSRPTAWEKPAALAVAIVASTPPAGPDKTASWARNPAAGTRLPSERMASQCDGMRSRCIAPSSTGVIAASTSVVSMRAR